MSDTHKFEYNVNTQLFWLYAIATTALPFGFIYITEGFDGLSFKDILGFENPILSSFVLFLSIPAIILFLLSFFVVIFQTKHGPQFLTITDDAVKIPPSAFSKLVIVRFDDIETVERYQYTPKGIKFLTIHLKNGKKLQIANVRFQNLEDFQSVEAFLQQRVTEI